MDQNYGFYQPDMTPIPQNPQNEVPPEVKTAKKYGIASLVLGIIALVSVSLCCCLIFLTPVLAILSIVFAIVARKKLGKFSGMMIAGLILSIIALVLFLIIILSFGIFVSTVEGMTPEEIPAWLAENMGITEEEFYEMFEQSMGMTYEEYVDSIYSSQPTE